MTSVAIEHPARHYILYLLSRRQYRVREILVQLIQQNFPMPTLEHELLSLNRQIHAVQESLVFPANYDPTNLKHGPTVKWLQRHRILDMWAMGPDMVLSFDILDSPSLRREVEIMLLGPLKYSDIAKRLADLHGYDVATMNASTIRNYTHYFWDVESMSAQKWPEFLYGMQASGDYLSVYSAPRSSVGASLSLYVATRGGSGIPKEQIMFRHVRDCCFMEFIKVSATRYPGMQKSAAMQGLVASLIQSQEQVDMRRGGSSEMLDELRRMENRYDERKLTSAEELPLHYIPADVERNLEKEKEGAS